MFHRFRLTLAWLLLGLLLIPAATLARDITPSDRVTTRVNVRAGASADQPIVGKLQRGETASISLSLSCFSNSSVLSFSRQV